LSALLGDAFFNMVRNGSISSDGIDDGCCDIVGEYDGVEVGDDEGLTEGFQERDTKLNQLEYTHK
jgi:hypothetical protein